MTRSQKKGMDSSESVLGGETTIGQSAEDYNRGPIGLPCAPRTD